MTAIETRGLTKVYGEYAALQDFSFRIASGTLYGFLGPNGAGKSTMIRILLGLLRATRGEATIFGNDVWSCGNQVRRDIGYLPGDVRFYAGMTGKKLLDFVNRARGGGHQREYERLASVFSLDIGRKIRVYSRGMKQKLGLIQALMHRPKLLVLDEPTTALDPLVRQVLFDELRAVCTDGRTVLFSSHTLSEVEELCDRVAILRRGRLVEEDSIDHLRQRAIRHVRAIFEPGGAPKSPPPAALRVAHRTDGFIEGAWTGPTRDLIGWLAEGAVRDATIAAPRLEDLFMSYYTTDGDAPIVTEEDAA